MSWLGCDSYTTSRSRPARHFPPHHYNRCSANPVDGSWCTVAEHGYSRYGGIRLPLHVACCVMFDSVSSTSWNRHAIHALAGELLHQGPLLETTRPHTCVGQWLMRTSCGISRISGSRRGTSIEWIRILWHSSIILVRTIGHGAEIGA